jgi:hypothetical protein
VTTDPFTIDFISPSTNAVFQAPSTLDATPELEVGALNNHVITHQNTQYVRNTTEYVFSFETTSAVPSGGKVIFTFPDSRILKDSSTTMVVTTGSSFGTTVSGVTVTYDGTDTWVTQIELTDVCTSGCAVDSYQFKIAGGIKNPDYVETLTGNFVTYTSDSSGAVVNRDIVANSDVSAILPYPVTATITRNVATLGDATNLTISFTTENTFPSGGKIIFKMPTDQITLGTGITCYKGDLSTTLTCSNTTEGSYYVITINEWCTVSSPTCAAGAALSFVIEGLSNPNLLSANVATTSWEVLTATSSSYPIDGAYTSLKPSPDLEGVTVTVSLVTIDSPIVYAQTTLSVSFTPNSDLPSNALIQIGLPSEFALAPSTESCAQLFPSTATLSCTYTSSGGCLQSIEVTNPCSNSD